MRLSLFIARVSAEISILDRSARPRSNRRPRIDRQPWHPSHHRAHPHLASAARSRPEQRANVSGGVADGVALVLVAGEFNSREECVDNDRVELGTRRGG